MSNILSNPEEFEDPIQINGVCIGDQFLNIQYKKSNIISTVVDIYEVVSLSSGGTIRYECIAQHDFLGQTLTYNVPFATVVRNRIPEKD